MQMGINIEFNSQGPLMVETLHNRMLQIGRTKTTFQILSYYLITINYTGVVSWGDLERRKTEGLFTDVSAALYTNVSQPGREVFKFSLLLCPSIIILSN